MASANLTESAAPGPSPRLQHSRRARRRNSLADHPPSSELAFPGCKPVHLPREGTRPEDDPISRTIARHAEARGHEKGREEGRREAAFANALAVLRARGIEPTARLAGDRVLFGSVPGDVLIEAAVTCRDEADFRRRIRNEAR